jgi:hypothetical protein
MTDHAKALAEALRVAIEIAETAMRPVFQKSDEFDELWCNLEPSRKTLAAYDADQAEKGDQ